MLPNLAADSVLRTVGREISMIRGFSENDRIPWGVSAYGCLENSSSNSLCLTDLLATCALVFIRLTMMGKAHGSGSS